MDEDDRFAVSGHKERPDYEELPDEELQNPFAKSSVVSRIEIPEIEGEYDWVPNVEAIMQGMFFDFEKNVNSFKIELRSALESGNNKQNHGRIGRSVALIESLEESVRSAKNRNEFSEFCEAISHANKTVTRKRAEL